MNEGRVVTSEPPERLVAESGLAVRVVLPERRLGPSERTIWRRCQASPTSVERRPPSTYLEMALWRATVRIF